MFTKFCKVQDTQHNPNNAILFQGLSLKSFPCLSLLIQQEQILSRLFEHHAGIVTEYQAYLSFQIQTPDLVQNLQEKYHLYLMSFSILLL